MTTNWATRTAETLRREHEKEKNNMDQLLKETSIIAKQAGPQWERLCSTIRQMAADLSKTGTYLQESKHAGTDQFIMISRMKGHMVLTFVPGGAGIRYELHAVRSATKDPQHKGIFNFEVKADNVWLTDNEGHSGDTAQVAEYLLDLLVWIDRKDS